MECSQQVCCSGGSHPRYSLPLRKNSVWFGFAFLGKREGEAFIVCFVLTMCNDMGQVFVSFDKGDVFSISLFYGSSLQSRWRVRTTDFAKNW